MPTMSTNLSPSKISTSTRSPAFTAALSSPFSSASIGTSRMNFTGGTLFFARWPRMGWVSFDSFMNSTRPICAESYPSLVWDLCCVTTQGPACNTVAGCTSPLESNNCVIPTFLPRIPAIFAISLIPVWRERPRPRPFPAWPQLLAGELLLMLFAERLNLHIHAGRKIELHQRVHRLRRRIENVQQPLVRADLELLARFLIHVRRTQHRVFILHRRQWNRPGNLRAGPFRRGDVFRC